MTKDERIDQLSSEVMELREQLRLAQIRAADSEDKAQALAARVERLERSLVMSAIVGDSLYGALLSMLSDNPDEGQAEAAIGQWLDHERPDEIRFVLAKVRSEAINDVRRCIAIVSHARDGAGYVDGMVDADTQWNGKLKAHAQRLIDEAGE